MGRKAGVSADQTRKELIAAAAKVFAEKGYEGATIADIARRAGLSTGAIYAHYRSKAELLKLAIRAQSAREAARMWADCDPGDLDLLHALVAGGSAFGRRHGGHGSLLIEAAGAARRDPDVAEAMAAEVGGAERRFVALLRKAQERGATGFHASPEVIARFSLMLNLGSQVIDALGLPAVEQDEWRAFIVDLVHGFRPPPGAEGNDDGHDDGEGP